MTFINAEIQNQNNDNNNENMKKFKKNLNNNDNMKNNENKNIYIKTPLIESVILKKYCCNRNVYLKMENCQPSGSFKLRGLSNLCQYAKSKGYERFVCPSGGNAGMATAYSARKLGMPCHIVVNKQTPESTRETIAAFGATVEIYGNSVNESVVRARQLTTEDSKLFLIHPFDHKAIWDGHSSMIDEIAEELMEEPSIIVTCCGGGGLTNGIVRGCRRYGWTTTKILTMESIGCHSFNHSLKNGKRLRLEQMTSKVVCLSCNEVCQEILDEYHKAEPPILSRLVEDRDAADACLKFADDHRVLVGLACGTCLAALYKGMVERILNNDEDPKEKELDKIKLDINGNRIDEYDNGGPIVVIVCGGAEISLNQMDFYRQLWNLTV